MRLHLAGIHCSIDCPRIITSPRITFFLPSGASGARVSSSSRALQGGVRGWVTSFCAKYVGHAPAARTRIYVYIYIYERTARTSRKPRSGFTVLVFSGTHTSIRPAIRSGENGDGAAATAGIFTTARLIAQLKQSFER